MFYSLVQSMFPRRAIYDDMLANDKLNNKFRSRIASEKV
jgi:hypothetical protein